MAGLCARIVASLPVSVLLGAAALVWLAGAWLAGTTAAADSPTVMPVVSTVPSVGSTGDAKDPNSAGGAPKSPGATQPNSNSSSGSTSSDSAPNQSGATHPQQDNPGTSGTTPQARTAGYSAPNDQKQDAQPLTRPPAAPAQQQPVPDQRDAAPVTPGKPPAEGGAPEQGGPVKPAARPGDPNPDQTVARPAGLPGRPQPGDGTAPATQLGASKPGQPDTPNPDCPSGPNSCSGTPAVPPNPAPVPSSAKSGGGTTTPGSGGSQPSTDNNGWFGSYLSQLGKTDPQQPNGLVPKDKAPHSGLDPPQDGNPAPFPNALPQKSDQPTGDTAKPRPSAATWTPPKDEEGFLGSIRHAWRSIVGGDNEDEPTDGGFVPAHGSTPAKMDDGRADPIDMVQGGLDLAGAIPGPEGRGFKVAGSGYRGLKGLMGEHPPAPAPRTPGNEAGGAAPGPTGPRVLPRPNTGKTPPQTPPGPGGPKPPAKPGAKPNGQADRAPTGTAGTAPGARTTGGRPTGRDDNNAMAGAGARPSGPNRKPLTNSANSNRPGPRGSDNNTPRTTGPGNRNPPGDTGSKQGGPLGGKPNLKDPNEPGTPGESGATGKPKTRPRDAPIDPSQVSKKISPQKQGRHVEGSPLQKDGGYLKSSQDAQKVLDAFHNGSAEVLGRSTNGHIVVRYHGVTGYNNNARFGIKDQPTDVFLIKGTRSPSVVPYNPDWTPGAPR